MNKTTLSIYPEDGQSIELAKAAIDKLNFPVEHYIDRRNNKFLWVKKKSEHAHLSNSEYRVYEQWRSCKQLGWLYNEMEQSSNAISKLLETCPYGNLSLYTMKDWLSQLDIPYKKVNDNDTIETEELLFAKYKGNSSFKITLGAYEKKYNNVVCGYEISGRSWSPISWLAVNDFSRNNPDLIVKAKQRLNMSNSPIEPDSRGVEFIMSDPDIEKQIRHMTPNGDYLWKAGDKLIDRDTNGTAYLNVECECLNGGIISYNVRIELKQFDDTTNRHSTRIPENPWNALPEHVNWTNSGVPELAQPDGSGPMRGVNYSNNTDNGGAATRPIRTGRPFSDLSDEELDDARNQIVNQLMHEYGRQGPRPEQGFDF